MTNLFKRDPAPAASQAFDPFQEMRSLMSWDPFRNLRAYQAPAEMNFAPAFEVKETKDAFVFKADVPGIKEQDLEVHLTGDRLTVSGKRETEHTDKSDTFYAYERSFGSFSRAFTLPAGTDANLAKAELKEGVLNIVLPKVANAQPKKILVKSEDKAKA